jgi:hypothetical protein
VGRHNGILLTENYNEIYTHFTCDRRPVSICVCLRKPPFSQMAARISDYTKAPCGALFLARTFLGLA